MTKGLRDGPSINLPDLLAAKERRVTLRSENQQKQQLPTLTLTLVTPGPIKACPLTDLLADTAQEACEALFLQRGWTFECVRSGRAKTGPEALYVVACEAELLKRALVTLEDSHPLGRLWDLDVHAPTGEAISRRSIGDEQRRCFVCDDMARACARSQKHSLTALWDAMEQMVTDWQHACSKTP